MTGPQRAVIITGAAAGIGWATARRFVAKGDRVAILDRDAAAAMACAAELGGDNFALAVDIADEVALVETIEAAHARLGRVDVLINNAATIYYGGGPTLDLEMSAYKKLISVNVLGAEIAAREVATINGWIVSPIVRRCDGSASPPTSPRPPFISRARRAPS